VFIKEASSTCARARSAFRRAAILHLAIIARPTYSQLAFRRQVGNYSICKVFRHLFQKKAEGQILSSHFTCERRCFLSSILMNMSERVVAVAAPGVSRGGEVSSAPVQGGGRQRWDTLRPGFYFMPVWEGKSDRPTMVLVSVYLDQCSRRGSWFGLCGMNSCMRFLFDVFQTNSTMYRWGQSPASTLDCW